MKRITRVAGVAALVVIGTFAAVAVAQTIKGGPNGDALVGTNKADLILGRPPPAPSAAPVWEAPDRRTRQRPGTPVVALDTDQGGGTLSPAALPA